MTLDNMISRLLELRKYIDGNLPVYLLGLEAGIVQKAEEPEIKTRLKVGVGFKENSEDIKCVFIGDQADFEWFNTSEPDIIN